MMSELKLLLDGAALLALVGHFPPPPFVSHGEYRSLDVRSRDGDRGVSHPPDGVQRSSTQQPPGVLLSVAVPSCRQRSSRRVIV